MRRIILFILSLLLAVMIAGCSAIPLTQPRVTLPIRVEPISLNGEGGMAATIRKQPVDMSADARWARYAGQIEAVEAISLSMGVTNETGDEEENPPPVQVRLYVSEYQHLTADTLHEAELAVEATLPGGQRELRYDAGIPLSRGAGAVMRDGRFFLYAVAAPSDARLTLRDVTMTLKVRVSVV